MKNEKFIERFNEIIEKGKEIAKVYGYEDTDGLYISEISFGVFLFYDDAWSDGGNYFVSELEVPVEEIDLPISFFEEKYKKLIEEEKKREQERQKSIAKEKERKEIAELERLKAKYEAR